MSAIAQFLDILIKVLESIPTFGPYLGFLAQGALGLSTLISSIVAVWKVIADLLKTLGSIFHSDKLTSWGMALSVSEEKLYDYGQSYIIPILNRFSVIPLPKIPRDFVPPM